MWKLIQEINLGFVKKSNIFGKISKVPKSAKMPSIICIVSCLFELNKTEKNLKIVITERKYIYIINQDLGRGRR